jgi:hypothetical protein
MRLKAPNRLATNQTSHKIAAKDWAIECEPIASDGGGETL